MVLKKSIPNSSVMSEYLFVYGMEWITEYYGLTPEKVKSIIYGGKKLPDLDREQPRQYNVNQSVYLDKFIWDEQQPVVRQSIRRPDTSPVVSIDEIIETSNELWRWVFIRNNKGMKNHGWVSGNITVSKHNSKSVEDRIQEILLKKLKRYYESLNK